MNEKFYDDDEKREMTISVDQGGVLLELPEYISSFWLLPENVDLFCQKLKEAATLAKQTRPFFEENEDYWISKNKPDGVDDSDELSQVQFCH